MTVQLVNLSPWTEAATRNSGYSARLVASVDDEIVAANTEFGFNLLAELVGQGKGQNVFISPFSISTALAMTYNSAAGKTAAAMAAALRYDGMSLDEVNEASSALLRDLDAMNPEVEIAIANSIWARQGLPVRPDFLDRNRRYFDAEVATLDFNDPEAVVVINQWVKANTKEKIDSIIDKIEPDDVMYLINAIYFNGRWFYIFAAKKTRDRIFHLADGTQKQHAMMSRSGSYAYLETEDFQAVKLPYIKRNVGMYVFFARP